LQMNTTAASLMVHELAQRGDLAEALRWYAQMRHSRMDIDADVFKSLMRVIADKGEYADFAGVMYDMQNLRIYADKTLCSHALRFYARLGYTQEAKDMFEYMKAHGFVPSRAAYNALVIDLSKSGGASEEREKLVNDMSAHGVTPTRAAYEAALATHVKENNAVKVESIVEEMANKGLAPKVGDYNVRMRVWAAQGNAEKCEELVKEMEAKEIKPDLYTIGSMLSCYAHNLTEESVKKCEEWWKKIKTMEIKANTVTYNVMMKVYDKMRWPESCWRLLEEMKEEKVPPDRITFNTMIHAYMLWGKREKVDLLYKEMEIYEIIPDKFTFMCLLKLMAKKKRGVNDVANLRTEMRKRGIQMDVHMYTTLIDMYGKDGNKIGCIQIWKEMQKNGTVPSDVTLHVMKKYVDLDSEEFKKT
jgi:pentatricopeptide repeat protein